jgi:F0F1-type ATP synthase assembly protein I
VAAAAVAAPRGPEELRVNRSDEPRSPLADGIAWASRVSTVGLEFVVPPLLGLLLDRWLHTTPFALLVGAVLGFAAGMRHILQIAREGPGPGAAAERGGAGAPHAGRGEGDPPPDVH